MTTNEFLNKCPACGGNWAAMLMGGIRELFPDVYREMEDKTYSFEELVEIITVKCGVKPD